MGIAITTGISSGIDYDSIIDAYVDVEQAKIDTVTAKQEAYETEISAYGAVQSALATFQDSIEALTDSEDLYSYTATSSDEDLLTVAVTGSAQSGTYQLTVSQIAKQEMLIGAGGFTSETAEVGTGVLSIAVGDGAAVEIEIGDDQNTLEGIVDAINDADAGVTASITQVSDGAYALVLTADENSESISFSVTSDGDADTTDSSGLSSLYADASDGSMTVAQEGSTAIFSLGSQTFERSTNEIDDLINGVTINLEEAESGTTVTVHVKTSGDSGLSTKIQTMVSAYNDFVDTLATYQDSSDEDTVGVLVGDSLANQLKSKVANMLFTEVDTDDSAISYLCNLGVTIDSEGKLEFDEDAFSDAVDENETAVVDFFTNEDSGFAVSMDTLLSSYLDTGGIFDSKTEGLQTSADELDDKISGMEDDLVAYKDKLTTQFAALETLLSNLKNTQDSLTSLIESLDSTS